MDIQRWPVRECDTHGLISVDDQDHATCPAPSTFGNGTCGMKLSKPFEVIPSPGKQTLSAGDGIAVFALLLFICGWIAGWLAGLQFALDPNVKLGWVETFVYISILGGPSFWAARLITHIVNPSATKPRKTTSV